MLKAPTAVHKIDLRHSFTNFQVQKEKSPGVLNLSYSINKLLSSNNQNSGLGVRWKEEMSVNVYFCCLPKWVFAKYPFKCVFKYTYIMVYQ